MQNLTFFGCPVVEIPIIYFFLNHHHHRWCPPLFPPHHCCLLATITDGCLPPTSVTHYQDSKNDVAMPHHQLDGHQTHWQQYRGFKVPCHQLQCGKHTTNNNIVVVYGSTQHKSFITSIPTNIANDDYTTPHHSHTMTMTMVHNNDWWCTLRVTTTEVVTKWWMVTSVAVCCCYLLGEIGPPPLLFFTNHPFQVPCCQQQCVATRQWMMTSITILLIMVCELECSILAHALLFLYNK